MERRQIAGSGPFIQKAESPRSEAVREGDLPVVAGEFLARRLIFHRAAVFLKLRKAFLTEGLVLAVFREAHDGRRSVFRSVFRSGLPGLRVQLLGEVELFGKDGAILVEVVGIGVCSVLPAARVFVPNELASANCFLKGLELFVLALQLVFIHQHTGLL